MLRRSQVARRLGRSVATVRRLEGTVLFPERDRRGIYRFDEGEVADLARRVRNGDVELWREFAATGSSDWRGWLGKRDGSVHRQSVGQEAGSTELRKQCTEAEQRVRSLTAENDQLRDLARELGDLVVKISSPSILREIGPELLKTLQALEEQ